MPYSSLENYYSVLKINQDATSQEITNAYKAQALRNHPDKAQVNNLTDKEATEAFQAIGTAYEVLKDPVQRRAYDLKLKGTTRPMPNFTSFNPFDFDFSPFGTSFHQQQRPDPIPTIYPDRLKQELHDLIDKGSVKELEKYLSCGESSEQLLGSILYEACKMGKLGIVKYLIEDRHISPHLKIDAGLTFTGPIFKAAAGSGDLDLVKYLLETHHIDIESQGLTFGTKCSALSRAAKKGHAAVVEYLISKGANLNPVVGYGDILKDAISSESLQVVGILIEAGSKLGEYHLQKALKEGSLSIAQYILEKRPGLHTHSCISGSFACEAIRSGNVELVKYLMEHESLDLFAKESLWTTHDDVIMNLLTAAGVSGSIEMVRFLLKEEKIMEKCTGPGNYEKLKYKLLSAAVSRSLVKREVSPFERVQLLSFLIDEEGLLPNREEIERIVENGPTNSPIEINAYLQSYLLEPGDARKLLRLVAREGLEGLSFVQLFWLYTADLIKKGKYCGFKDEIHYHIHGRELSLEKLRFLASIDHNFRQNALFYYSEYYHEKDLTRLKLLVEPLGADVNGVETHRGTSPALYAMRSGGYNAIVKYLIDQGADVYRKDKHGRSIHDVMQRDPEYLAQLEKLRRNHTN